MEKNIKILILEDTQSDADLLVRELKKSGFIFSSEIVQTRETFENALQNFKPDLILSDYNLPSFDGETAFFIKQKKSPNIPFIIVSSAIGDEKAVELIKKGVTDYVLKDKLFSLAPKITRALKEEEEKREKRIANEKFKNTHKKLIQSEARIKNYARHLNQVTEDERAHLAREIHDDIGQQLIVITIGLSELKTQDGTNAIMDERLNIMINTMNDTIQSIREITTTLRPAILDTLGLIPSIKWQCVEFEKKTKIKCKVELNVKEEKFDRNISICYFRICQETLTNIKKHAGPCEVIISIEQNNNELTLKISDNGKGIANEKLANPFSMGLIGMQERANIIGADLNITSKKDFGTTVQLKVKTN